MSEEKAPFERGASGEIFKVPPAWSGPKGGYWIVPEANPDHPDYEKRRARDRAGWEFFMASIQDGSINNIAPLSPEWEARVDKFLDSIE